MEISGLKLKTVEIPLPSLEEQSNTVEKLDLVFTEIEDLRTQIKMKKSLSASLRQSLLSNAFNQEEVAV